MAYICNACGNKTRFDVYETKTVRAFHHFTLGGESSIEEEEVLERDVEKIVCRWCSSTDVGELDLPASEDAASEDRAG